MPRSSGGSRECLFAHALAHQHTRTLLSLALLPRSDGWTNTSAVSSWGGGPPAYDAATGMYHLFVSEMAAHCGESTWARMSQSAHAVSDTVEGPYERVDLVIPTVSHNTFCKTLRHVPWVLPTRPPKAAEPPLVRSA